MSNSVAPNSATPSPAGGPGRPDLTHLAHLIEAAKAEADRLGAPGAPFARALADLAGRARAEGGRTGRSDEGLRPEDLTTDNDR